MSGSGCVKTRNPKMPMADFINMFRQYAQLENTGWVRAGYSFPEWVKPRSEQFSKRAAQIRWLNKSHQLPQEYVDVLTSEGFVWSYSDVKSALALPMLQQEKAENGSSNPALCGTAYLTRPERRRVNSIFRGTGTRQIPEHYPDTLPNVEMARDAALSFGLIYSEALISRARSDSIESLARRSVAPILDDLKKTDIGRLAADNAVCLFWSPVFLLPEMYDVFDQWGFSVFDVARWSRVMKPGHCYSKAPYEKYLVGVRGSPSWKLRHIDLFMRDYKGIEIEREDRLLGYFERGCDGPCLEIFGDEPRPGWTVLREPEWRDLSKPSNDITGEASRKVCTVDGRPCGRHMDPALSLF